MIIHNVEQGTEEWLNLRLGVPTASRFKDIYTSTGKASTSVTTYMHQLLAEPVAGKSIETYANKWMERGTEMEAEARGYYELIRDVEVEQVGFVLNDLAGCSPDGLTDRGGVEIKCPKAETHIKYLLGGKCPAEYFPQVQGCMWLCERQEWDFISYHPDLPQFILTVYRDDKWLDGLKAELEKLHKKMNEFLEKLKNAN